MKAKNRRMANISESVVIHAPIERVYQYVTNPENWVQFLPDLLEHRVFAGAPGEVGQRWTWRFNAIGTELKGSSEVVAVEPLRKWIVKISGNADTFWTFRFARLGSNTELILEVDTPHLHGPMEKLAAPIVAHMEDRHIRDSLANIKKILEQDGSPGGT